MKKRRRINRGAVLMLALTIALILGFSAMAVANKAAQPELRQTLEAVVEDYTALLLLPEEYRPADAGEPPEETLDANAKSADKVLRPYFAETDKTYETVLRRLRQQWQTQAEDPSQRLLSLERTIYAANFSFEPGVATVNFQYIDRAVYADSATAKEGMERSGQATFRREDGGWKLLYFSMEAPSPDYRAGFGGLGPIPIF